MSNNANRDIFRQNFWSRKQPGTTINSLKNLGISVTYLNNQIIYTDDEYRKAIEQGGIPIVLPSDCRIRTRVYESNFIKNTIVGYPQYEDAEEEVQKGYKFYLVVNKEAEVFGITADGDNPKYTALLLSPLKRVRRSVVNADYDTTDLNNIDIIDDYLIYDTTTPLELKLIYGQGKNCIQFDQVFTE